jgi:thioredoxin reductase (NADPH)
MFAATLFQLVRAQSVKRVASAVGEGSIAISLVHRVLAEL